jgi:hypothetical protein
MPYTSADYINSLIDFANAHPSGAGGFGINYTPYQHYTAPSTVSPPPAIAAPIPPMAAGIEPQAYEAILYGKVIPVIAGSPLLGFRIIEGPWWGGDPTAPIVSFIASAGMPANPAGTNVFTDIRIRGKRFAFDGAATIGDGDVRNLTDSSVTGATVEVRTGTETQLPFQSSIDRYGARAIAYRPHFLIELKNIPIAAFGGIIPMSSGQIHNTTYGLDLDEGVTRNDALTEFLGYMRLAPADFEVSVLGRDVAWIASEQQQLVEFLQNLRAEFVHWNITFRDKMRVIEPTTIPVEALLTPANTLRASVKLTQADPLVQAREKIASFIDIDRDYEPNTASARADSFPIPTTLSINSQTNNLPIVGHVSEMEADVNVSLFEELASIDQMTATVMPSKFGIEASDGFQYLDDRLSFTGRIFETQRDLSKFYVQITGAEVLNCTGSGSDVIEDLSPAALFLVADSTSGADPGHANGNGYAPIIPIDLGSALPLRTQQNFSDFCVAACTAPSGNGLSVFVNDSEAHEGAFESVLSDGTYVYHIDYDTGFGDTPDGYIVRLRLSDFGGRTVLDWGTAAYEARGVAGFAFSSVILGTKLYIAVDADGSADSYVAVINLSNFTTGAIEYVTLGAGLRPYGMAALGSYVYIATATATPDNYIHRLKASDNTLTTINGGSGASHRLYGGVADAATGKIFFSPEGKQHINPTANEVNVGVLDTNVTFNDAALTFFDVTQDSNVRLCGYSNGIV